MQPIAINPVDFLGWIAAILGSIGAIWKGVLPAYKWIRKEYRERKNRQQNLDKAMKLVGEINLHIGGLADKMEMIADNQKAMINSSEQMVLIFDSMGHLEMANKKFLRFIGKDSQEVSENNWLKIVHQEDREKVQQEWHRSVKDCRDFIMEFRIHANGKGVVHVLFDGTREKHRQFVAVKHKEAV